MSKLFLKYFINFFVKWGLHVQNAVWIRVPHPIFAAALCGNREYLGGGRVLGCSFLNSLHAQIRSGPFLLAHSSEDKYSLQAAEGQKAQYCLGVSAQMLHSAHSLNCRIEKG